MGLLPPHQAWVIFLELISNNHWWLVSSEISGFQMQDLACGEGLSLCCAQACGQSDCPRKSTQLPVFVFVPLFLRNALCAFILHLCFLLFCFWVPGIAGSVYSLPLLRVFSGGVSRLPECPCGGARSAASLASSSALRALRKLSQQPGYTQFLCDPNLNE